MGWDFERGGLVEVAPRKGSTGLAEALGRVLAAPGTVYAQGLAVGLVGVSCAHGLGWRVEVVSPVVVRVECRARRGLGSWCVTVVRRGDWTAQGGVVEALMGLI